jgi:heat shock protein HtpX
MQSIKRFLLVFGVNIGIIVMLSLLVNLLSSYFGISLTGSSYNSLMVFALIFGFGGAYINLLISRRMAKRMYKIELIDATVSDPRLRAVYQTVQQIADNNQIRMPEVGIYQDANPNAFATGSSANSSLVAVSSGLLHAMTDEEVKGVV